MNDLFDSCRALMMRWDPLFVSGAAAGWVDEYDPVIEYTLTALAAGGDVVEIAREVDTIIGVWLGNIRVPDEGEVPSADLTPESVKFVAGVVSVLNQYGHAI